MTYCLTYSLFDPTGNITMLVESPVPEELQPQLAQKLMKLEPDSEQVGFVSENEGGIALRMAGGEFCGNASMSTAVLHLMRRGVQKGEVTFRVSGAPAPVRVTAAKQSDECWLGSVMMPRPLSACREIFPDGIARPVVRFPGITHVILEEEMDRRTAEKQAAVWCRTLGADALGIMFLNREKKTLKPLVFVPAAETLFWESSCASGTTAVGAYLASASGREVCLALAQPGGTLEIRAEPDGVLCLSGKVRPIRRCVDVML